MRDAVTHSIRTGTAATGRAPLRPDTPRGPDAHRILALQRNVGNAALTPVVQRFEDGTRYRNKALKHHKRRHDDRPGHHNSHQHTGQQQATGPVRSMYPNEAAYYVPPGYGKDIEATVDHVAPPDPSETAAPDGYVKELPEVGRSGRPVPAAEHIVKADNPPDTYAGNKELALPRWNGEAGDYIYKTVWDGGYPEVLPFRFPFFGYIHRFDKPAFSAEFPFLGGLLKVIAVPHVSLIIYFPTMRPMQPSFFAFNTSQWMTAYMDLTEETILTGRIGHNGWDPRKILDPKDIVGGFSVETMIAKGMSSQTEVRMVTPTEYQVHQHFRGWWPPSTNITSPDPMKWNDVHPLAKVGGGLTATFSWFRRTTEDGRQRTRITTPEEVQILDRIRRWAVDLRTWAVENPEHFWAIVGTGVITVAMIGVIFPLVFGMTLAEAGVTAATAAMLVTEVGGLRDEFARRNMS